MRNIAKPLWFSVLAASMIFAGCAIEPKQPEFLASQYPTLGIEKIALLPVIFRDWALDSVYQHKIGEEIIWHSRKVLRKKGYDVALAYDPKKWTFMTPYKLPETGPERLAGLAPEGFDALLTIWVDKFLDSGGSNGRGFEGNGHSGSSDPLELYATASLISTAERREVWRDEGYGGGFGLPTSSRDHFLTPLTLADSLFTTLPARTGP